jgi:hypothetical protein
MPVILDAMSDRPMAICRTWRGWRSPVWHVSCAATQLRRAIWNALPASFVCN